MPRMLLAAAGLLLGTVAAQAQSSGMVEIEDSVMLMPWNMTVDAVEDAVVINDSGAVLGEVEEVIGPNANTPMALVVDFADSTGVSDDKIVEIERFQPDGNRLRLSTSLAEIATLPAWND